MDEAVSPRVVYRCTTAMHHGTPGHASRRLLGYARRTIGNYTVQRTCSAYSSVFFCLYMLCAAFGRNNNNNKN